MGIFTALRNHALNAWAKFRVARTARNLYHPKLIGARDRSDHLRRTLRFFEDFTLFGALESTGAPSTPNQLDVQRTRSGNDEFQDLAA